MPYKQFRPQFTRFRTIHLFLLALLLSGCAAKIPEQSIFYPPAPTAPRIQFLTSVANATDLKSGMAKTFSEGGFAFQRPFGVTFAGSKLFAVDVPQRGYAGIDPTNNALQFNTGDDSSIASRLTFPTVITSDKNGNKYVADPKDSRVVCYDAADKYVRSYKLPNKSRTGGVGVSQSDNLLYVGDTSLSEIYIYQLETGEFLRKFTTELRVKWPTDIDFDGDNNIIVTDTGNFAIYKFSPAGQLISQLGQPGDSPGTFARPKSIAIDKEDRIYVVDAAFGNVQIFDADSNLLLSFPSQQGGPGALSLPTTIALSYEAVQVYQPYAAKGFQLEYVIAVNSSFGPPRINIYGFGRLAGADYSAQ